MSQRAFGRREVTVARLDKVRLRVAEEGVHVRNGRRGLLQLHLIMRRRESWLGAVLELKVGWRCLVVRQLDLLDGRSARRERMVEDGRARDGAPDIQAASTCLRRADPVRRFAPRYAQPSSTPSPETA